MNRWMINTLLILALACFFAGIFLPLLTVSKFYIFNNEVSMWSGLMQLLESSQYGLFLALLLFSFVLPLSKLLLVLVMVNLRPARRGLSSRLFSWQLHHGKWSMLDVFVVALLVVTVKLGAVASVEVHAGIYFFAVAILLTMWISSRLAHSWSV